MFSKSELRKNILEKRKRLTQDEKESASKQIIKNLKNLDIFGKSTNILFYYPMIDEVNILPLIPQILKKSKTPLIPFIIDKENLIMGAAPVNNLDALKPGPYKIMEPEDKISFPQEEIDCVLVPGVVFDVMKNRIGMGKGFYDHFLPYVKNAVKIGIAFDFQIQKTIPHDDHDIPMDLIVTESEIT